MAYTDLHCHLLPGVDDGPDTLEETLAYAAEAAARGTATIVATPHVEQVDVSELPDRVREVRAALAAEGVDLEVRVGGELKPVSVGALTQAEFETIAHGPPGARWLLYEVPFGGVDDAFLDGARELHERGFAIVLAHPERSRGFVEVGLSLLGEELAAGSLLLSNVGPLIGSEGPERHDALRHLLERDLVHAVASDAHPPRRPYTLDLAGPEAWRAEGRTARLLRGGLAAPAIPRR